MVKRIVRMEKERGAAVVISCHDAQVLDELEDEVFLFSPAKSQEAISPGGQNYDVPDFKNKEKKMCRGNFHRSLYSAAHCLGHTFPAGQ